MSSTGDGMAFAVRLTVFEESEEDLLPTRITCRDKQSPERQTVEIAGIISHLPIEPPASYTGRNQGFGVLCGSV
jgi:hypothetical protein